MSIPYGIEEQYTFFMDFLKGPLPTLRIKEPYYETMMILTVAIHDWEKELGSHFTRIRYIESDTCSKRILTNRKTNQTKTILLDLVYTVDWVWKPYKQFVTASRLI